MFTYEARLKGIPASREQVVALYHSLNSPHLAVPGKQAGPAQAFLVGLRTANGFSMFIYLFMPESLECAVYLPSRRNVTAGEYQLQEAEALGFVESMGFMMDNMNFRSATPEAQDALIKSLPVFQKDPRALQAGGPKQEASKAANPLGRLFASF